QICIQADKNNETNSSVLDKILDEMGGSFEVQPIISLNKSKKMSITQKARDWEKESEMNNDEDLTDDDNKQADIEIASGWKIVAKLILNSKPDVEYSDDLKYDSPQLKFGMKQREYVHIDFGNKLESEPPDSNQKMSIKQKKDSGIPLGITAPFRSIRGWVGYKMKLFLQIKSRGERRIWTAIYRIKFILNESLATVKQLVNS
ncbi:20325_t:CDS:2, partial [Racocetra persica]